MLESQEVILDHLPVALIYEPPGPKGQQRLTSAQRFETRASVVKLFSATQTFGATLPKLGLEFRASDKFATEQEDGTWEIGVNTSAWQTWAHRFPGRGDVVAFFLRPKFRALWNVGTRTILEEGGPRSRSQWS